MKSWEKGTVIMIKLECYGIKVDFKFVNISVYKLTFDVFFVKTSEICCIIVLEINSLVKRFKIIQPHFNTMDEHSIKWMPIYWFRGMHKRKDLNLGRLPLTANLKIDRRLVIDHKWQEIHLSLLISPFYLPMLTLWDFSHQIIIQPSHVLKFILSYLMLFFLNCRSALPALNHVASNSPRWKNCQ